MDGYIIHSHLNSENAIDYYEFFIDYNTAYDAYKCKIQKNIQFLNPDFIDDLVEQNCDTDDDTIKQIRANIIKQIYDSPSEYIPMTENDYFGFIKIINGKGSRDW